MISTDLHIFVYFYASTICHICLYNFWDRTQDMYLCTGFRQNTLAEYTSGYIVGTYIISD